MTKTIPTIFTIALCLLAGGGCEKNSQLVTQPAVTYETPTTTPSSTSSAHNSENTSSTVSLLDRPVSEWPRYEFKELGFSIQLPEQKEIITISSCLTQNCPTPFLSVRSKKSTFEIIGSYASNYPFDTTHEIFDFQTTYLNKFTVYKNNLSLIFSNSTQPWKAELITSTTVQNMPVYFFNATKEYYDKITDDYYQDRVPTIYQAVFALPNKKPLPSIAVTFENTTIEQLKKIISTLLFNNH